MARSRYSKEPFHRGEAYDGNAHSDPEYSEPSHSDLQQRSPMHDTREQDSYYTASPDHGEYSYSVDELDDERHEEHEGGTSRRQSDDAPGPPLLQKNRTPSYTSSRPDSMENQEGDMQSTISEGFITVNQYLAVLRKKMLMPQVLTLHESLV